MLKLTTLLAELKELIQAKTNHPYLQMFLEKPTIDEDKLLLLAGLFNDLEITEADRKKYIVSTMLVQMALDAHESVTNSNVPDYDGSQMKSRQLTVLAGDYYSGLYYQLLAEVENITLIRVLASAIKDVNEHKILLYQKSLSDMSGLIKTLKAIESSLIRKVAESMGSPVWKDLAEDILLLNRLHLEKKSYLETGQSIIFEILKKMFYPKKDKSGPLSNEQAAFVLNKMDQCIASAHASLRRTLEKKGPKQGVLASRIGAILDYTAHAANSFVEEG
ncbi:heptaprenyl diphosphate synthase component 1 [Peribacillus glennii]|uniref:Heptaprenyl diphosphate synthase component 1 n=1 Tax=Peribacillus glennii TaxID=2303991 RepID=A0A372LHU6_9BACI|nr:heptaprenyl diphosphate synthase component 1 [Peribacillus glennii]RFU65542.1 heptaprenyl diphosphate synthase component 1 [Peribacillus glennii]